MSSDEIRVRLSEPVTQETLFFEAVRRQEALLAVLDLCDEAPVNGEVGVMFEDEIRHAIAVALGLPGDPRHRAPKRLSPTWPAGRLPE